MPLTSATTIALWFVEQVHLLRVYCTDTIPLTYGSLLKKIKKNFRKQKATFEQYIMMATNWWSWCFKLFCYYQLLVKICIFPILGLRISGWFLYNGAVLAHVM